MSLPELLLWRVLRDRPGGLKFRRQYPIGPFVADFACLACRLIVEVDGEAHDRGDIPRRDEAKDRYPVKCGFGVMRVPARDILGGPEAAVRGIVACRGERAPLHRPSAGPPPGAGEDLS